MGKKFCGLAGLVLLACLLGCSKTTSTVTNPPPSGTAYLYLTTQDDKKVTPYVINLADGMVKTNGDSVGTGDRPSAILLDPSGKNVFVLNSDSNDISAYTVNSDGTLVAVSGTTPIDVANVATNPVSMTMDAGGNFIFVADRGVYPGIPSAISVFQVSGTTLTPAPGSPFPAVGIFPSPVGTVALPEAVGIAVTPDGKYLYVTHKNDNVVGIYSVDASGALTPILAAVDVGVSPVGVMVSPDGNFLYVANSGSSSSISGFTICDNLTPSCTVADGSLTPMPNSPFSAGLGPVFLTTDPSTKFLYAVDQQSNQISEYTITPVSGALVGATQPTLSTGGHPTWIAVSPDGNYAYVANGAASSLSALRINTDNGVLGTIQAAVLTGGQPSAIVLKMR